MVVNIIHTALLACDGVVFHPDTTCPHCGGPLTGYDRRKKRFATLIEFERQIPLHVVISRGYCRTCQRIINPKEPFYPGTRAGAPVVDLCRSLSEDMPYGRAASYLGRMGIVVDRWSVRHYAQSDLKSVSSVVVFGIKVPVSIILLSTLVGSSEPIPAPDMEAILTACNYPGDPGSRSSLPVMDNSEK